MWYIKHLLIIKKLEWWLGKNTHSKVDFLIEKSNRDIELYKKQREDLVKVKNIIKKTMKTILIYPFFQF